MRDLILLSSLPVAGHSPQAGRTIRFMGARAWYRGLMEDTAHHGEEPMRIGLAARDAARRWEESAAAIRATDGEAVPEMQKVVAMAWDWSIGDRERGLMAFSEDG